LAAALAEAGETRAELGAQLVDLLVASKLCSSNGDARRTLKEGGVYVNNERVTDADFQPSATDVLEGGWLVLRRGKKRFAGINLA
jgi:tyrosyl-tRNA synthetase